MNPARNQELCREFLERAFCQGDLSAIDEYMDPNGVDHQEPPGTDFIAHLKAVVTGLRTAFPDLNFEIHDMLAEGEIVAFRSTMTGTHTGSLNMGPRPIPATGRQISVSHMHFVRMIDGKTTDLWHEWNLPMMLNQIGASFGERPNMPA